MDPQSTEQILREAGARFAFVLGSRRRGDHRPDSDLDGAAFVGRTPPAAFDILTPPGVDLVILDTAPLELAGRVAMEGELLLEDDPELRVECLARIRKVYADEHDRMERSHREFAEAVAAKRASRPVRP